MLQDIAGKSRQEEKRQGKAAESSGRPKKASGRQGTGKISAGSWKEWAQDRWPDVCILLLVFVLMTAWLSLPGAIKIAGPDEPMRYDVAKWLFAHPGQLPRGDAPELRNANWGTSYAFYPILSYMVSAFFMRIVRLFTDSGAALKIAARMAPALFITLAGWFTLRTGKRLFGKDCGRLYVCLVIFLPGFHYLGTYVNTDAFALLCAAMIFHAWAIALTEGWNKKACALLAVGMGLCFLSYYNAYGWILFSFFFFCLTILLCGKKPLKERFRELMSKGIVIAAITLGLSAWWFIRNAILYDGDFTGRKSFTITKDLYAIPRLRSENTPSPQQRGWSLYDFVFYQDPGWPHNWFILSLVSFVGTFGVFDLYMNETVSKLYLLILFACTAAAVILVRPFALHNRTVQTQKKKTASQRITVRTISKELAFSQTGVFHLCLAGAAITPFILYTYYAYTIDLQAQGRYFICAVYPVMYFVTLGLKALADRLFGTPQLRRLAPRLLAAAWAIGAVLNFVLVVVPAYA